MTGRLLEYKWDACIAWVKPWVQSPVLIYIYIYISWATPAAYFCRLLFFRITTSLSISGPAWTTILFVLPCITGMTGAHQWALPFIGIESLELFAGVGLDPPNQLGLQAWATTLENINFLITMVNLTSVMKFQIYLWASWNPRHKEKHNQLHSFSY
jgi:hypothetical protein